MIIKIKIKYLLFYIYYLYIIFFITFITYIFYNILLSLYYLKNNLYIHFIL